MHNKNKPRDNGKQKLRHVAEFRGPHQNEPSFFFNTLESHPNATFHVTTTTMAE